MDILLSLPVASYFFSASLTSWSTSLNLLFFYMTWSTLVLTHSPLQIEILGITALRIAFWLLPSLLFLAFDTLLPSLAENIKCNGTSALPPRDAKSLARLTGLALLNLALETAAEAGISLGLATLLKTPVFRTATTLPLPWQMIKHIALLFTGREILTYYTHRYVLHGHPPKLKPTKRTKPPAPTRTLTSLHTQHAHSRAAPPFALALKTDHPLPYLLHRFLPLYLPALALHAHNLHLLTFLLFAGLATLEETLTLSGYSVVPGILLGGMARRAAVHFRGAGGRSGSGRVGNFGGWGVLDWVHGTSLGGGVMADLRDEAEKHRVQERGARKAGEVGDAVRDGVEGWRKGSGRRKGKRGE
ncbi:hypothetical protein CHGG_04085 [Chaetomium globosum CBS 148.51]|uniref:Fatty acid hydroxylase domain-containing protein n=1 Tax=Chaetomium globosum (strain ATCC 6205 / CBS 148.51 / DSM 1962 / NBRC 6347 / NRRL 1970) TaxID=306901 RepID=Q2H2B1_CHAGB|nr:uncharacterized protein CHGG_04085 [Chaetomium globosum CBS 148.51]EAQ87466.1 hypothetical protein CHGG_04085 [Chaetomium globosum CBS 148.51]